MQLLSVKMLATAVVLPIALLLSACGGSSDSSGSDNRNNYSLKGYWKSECITDLSAPTIVYYNITENNNKLKSEEIIQEFQDASKNCTGKSEITNNGVFDFGTLNKPKINIEFVEKDYFLHIQNDSTTNDKTVKTDFHRISESDYNKIK